MNEIILQGVVNNHPLLEKNVKVVARNELSQQPGYYIVNNMNRGHGGEHWFALFINDNGGKEFFDSCGKHPSYYDLIVGNRNHVTFRLQSKKSDLCWAYCLFYICNRMYGMCLKNIVSKFTRNVSQNDRMVKHFIRNNM